MEHSLLWKKKKTETPKSGVDRFLGQCVSVERRKRGLYSLTREAAEAFLKKVKASPTKCISGPRDLFFKEVLKARDDGAKAGTITSALCRRLRNMGVPLKVGYFQGGKSFRFYLKE